MSKKTENYTAEEVITLRTTYAQGKNDEQRKRAVTSLAEELGRSEASIRAKLVNLGIYQKAERKAKDGSDIERKGDIVNDIAELCGESAELFDSLEKANKVVLKALRDALQGEAEEVETDDSLDDMISEKS